MKRLLAILPFLLAAPGLAQTPEKSQFEQAAMLLIGPCNRAEPAKDPAAAISECQKFLANMVQVKTQIAPATPHDVNVDLITRAMAEIRIGRSYGVQDTARTQRVCTQVETAWTILAGTDVAASPDYASAISSLKGEQAKAATLCRTEFGTPAGATPLPS